MVFRGEEDPDVWRRLPAERLAIWLPVLASAGVAWRLRAPRYAVDDAWISFRVARTWLDGGGLTFDAARAPVEGMTNLLWTLLSAAWIAWLPDVDPIGPARVLGLLCHLATVALLAWLAARETRLAGGPPAVAALAAGGLAATSTSLVYNAMSGLETGLWGLLFAAALERAFAASRGDRAAALACGGLLGLLAWTRPEGVLVGAAAVVLLGARGRTRGAARAAALPFGVAVAALCALRWSVYGSLVPNTFYAKPPAPGYGLAYLRSFVLYGLGVLGPLAALPALRRLPGAAGVAIVCGVLALGTVWSGGDWMPGFRRFALVTLGLCLLMGCGLALARGAWRGVAAAALAAVLAAHAYTGATLVGRGFHHAAWADLGRRARESAGIEQVALADIGVFAWHFPGSVFDLAGLTDAHIARLPGALGEKEWDEAYFRARSPELVLVVGSGDWSPPLGEGFRVRGFERDLLRSLVTNGGYRYHGSLPLAGSQRMLVLPRQDVALDPAVWGEPDARDLLAELARLRERKLARR